MKLRFIGKTLAQYKGVDGLGGLVSVRKGDVCEVEDKTGESLLRHYSRDFEIWTEQKAEHAPKVDKELRKGFKFKAK